MQDETSAVYAVTSDGSLRWRYPRNTASLEHVIWARAGPVA